jgi:hypothetical protein
VPPLDRPQAGIEPPPEANSFAPNGCLFVGAVMFDLAAAPMSLAGLLQGQ